MFGTEQKDGDLWANLQEAGAYSDLIVAGDVVIDDCQVVARLQQAPDGTVELQDRVCAVTGSSKKIAAGAETRDVIANGRIRVGGLL